MLQGPVRVIMSTQATSPLAAAWSALCSCLSSSSKGRSGGERSEGTKGEKSAKGAKGEPPPPPEEQEELEQQLQVAAYAVIVPLPLLLAAPFHPSGIVLRVEASVAWARWC